MDPVTITATISSVTLTLAKASKALCTLFEVYTSAQRTLFLIQAECTVITAALSSIQTHVSSPGVGSPQKRPSPWTPEVIAALDLSLLGCCMTLEVLEKEIGEMTGEVRLESTLRGKLGRMGKARYVWREDSMVALLGQMRGQSAALGILLKAVEFTSIDRIRQILESGRPVFRAVERDSASIRETNTSKRYPKSIAEMSMAKPESIYDIIKDNGGYADFDSLETDDESWSISSEKIDDTFGRLDQGMTRPFEAWRRTDQEGMIEPQSIPPGINFAQLSIQPKPPVRRKPISHPVAPTPAPSILPPTTPMPWEIRSSSSLLQEIQAIHKKSQVPGIAVGMVINSQSEIFVAGVRKHGNSTPIVRTDAFSISGLTEIMTSTVLARFVERGKVRWTQRIDELLPEFSQISHQQHSETTLEMLAAHLSGISEPIYAVENGQLWVYLCGSLINGGEGRRGIALAYLRRPPDRAPGTNFWHWGNYAIIGLILERLAGVPFEVVMKNELFDPLEMYHTGFGYADVVRNSQSANPTQPWPHEYTDGSPMINVKTSDLHDRSILPPALHPCAGIHSSLPDLCTFLQLHLESLMVKSKTSFLKKESLEMLHSPVGTSTSTRCSMHKSQRNWAGGETWSFRTNSLGFAASVWFAPRVKKAIISLVNLSGDRGHQVEDECASACTRFNLH
ncbi:beta-lactamase/transpeptidase-like protein [Bisporella sp. PMI_857]|nr:beta-lactamase/transpeptidase-like protein [Bisporella sp. PMI_857]